MASKHVSHFYLFNMSNCNIASSTGSYTDPTVPKVAEEAQRVADAKAAEEAQRVADEKTAQEAKTAEGSSQVETVVFPKMGTLIDGKVNGKSYYNSERH